jgi:2-iminobutanoate/2-iminopropanoate deaminase
MTSTVPKRAIRTNNAPTPTGPFNQAIHAGNMIFTAGQAGRNRETGQMGDIRQQTDWALRNIGAILEAAGASLDDVVKTTVYLKEGADSAAMSEEYAGHFHEPLPARSSVVVTRLKNAEMLVEIEAIAIVDG